MDQLLNLFLSDIATFQQIIFQDFSVPLFTSFSVMKNQQKDSNTTTTSIEIRNECNRTTNQNIGKRYRDDFYDSEIYDIVNHELLILFWCIVSAIVI